MDAGKHLLIAFIETIVNAVRTVVIIINQTSINDRNIQSGRDLHPKLRNKNINIVSLANTAMTDTEKNALQF